MSADALRSYVRTLRQLRNISQPDVADAIGMALRTYKSWEVGETRDIKTPYLLRAVRFLRGSFDQVATIPDSATVEDGAILAHELVDSFAPLPDETPEEASRINRLLDLLAQGVAPDEAARQILHEP
jgi:transcriptional regulator with XRE-family HTH domain